MPALKMLLVRVDLSGISFVLGVTEETVLEWLGRAASKAEQINRHLLRELPVTEVQLDEMWNFIEKKRSKKPGDGPEAAADSEDGRQWVWIAFAPEFRLMLSCFVGPRTYGSALSLVSMIAQMVTGGSLLFLRRLQLLSSRSDSCLPSDQDLCTHGQEGARPKKPVVEPHPDLVYAQVVKEKQKGRLKTLSERVICGAERLKELGLKNLHQPDREAQSHTQTGALASYQKESRVL